MQETDVAIRVSKEKSVKSFVLFIVGIIAGIIMFNFEDNYDSAYFYLYLLLPIFYFAYFTLAAFMSLYLIICKPVLLLVNNEGITRLSANGKNKMLLPWSEIEGFGETQKRKKSIIIRLHSPKSYMDNKSSWIGKFIKRRYFKKYGSPYLINTKMLDISHENLWYLLFNSLKKYRQAPLE